MLLLNKNIIIDILFILKHPYHLILCSIPCHGFTLPPYSARPDYRLNASRPCGLHMHMLLLNKNIIIDILFILKHPYHLILCSIFNIISIIQHSRERVIVDCLLIIYLICLFIFTKTSRIAIIYSFIYLRKDLENSFILFICLFVYLFICLLL